MSVQDCDDFEEDDSSLCENLEGISLPGMKSEPLESTILCRLFNAHEGSIVKNQAGFRSDRGYIKCASKVHVLEHRCTFIKPTISVIFNMRAFLCRCLRMEDIPEKLSSILTSLFTNDQSSVRGYGHKRTGQLSSLLLAL